LRFRLDPVPLSLAEAGGQFTGARVALQRAIPSPGEELLAVDDLRVEYGETTALAGASFSLREGEVVALAGANGSGKTTLLRAIAGLAPAARGRARLNGRPAPAQVGARTASAALLPQDPAYVFFRDRVRDEIQDSLRNRNLAADGAAANAVLRHWEIEHLAERNPRDVSVGQQQRIALATMLAHEPRTWLLDEPTRGADGPAKAWLAQRLRAHAARGGAAIVATHDVEAAARFATRVIGLAGGEIQFDLPARVAFGAGGPLPTDTARLVPGAIVPEEVQPA
jgi:energy-coupling factor transport system ATP-binding protein